MNKKLSYRDDKRRPGITWFVIVLSALTVTACNQNGQKKSAHQTGSSIGMDRSMQHDSMPGMNDTAGTAINETYWNTLPTNRTVIGHQKVVKPVFSDTNFTITGNGFIAFDTRRNRKLPVRVGGRIERLYVKYNYQYVRKGEKILELYSPELNTDIEEYLYVVRQTSDTILQHRAKQKLLLLGLVPEQVQRIEQTGKASFTIPLYSPFEGYVLFNPSAPAAMSNTGNAGSMDAGMSGGNSLPAISGSVLSDNSIREGMYVSKDQTLFWINDFKQAWAVIAFTKENEKYIRRGQAVTINSELFPENPVHTTIQLVEQVYGGGQKFTQARVYIPNTARILKQNSLITATVSIPVTSLTIPASSVYYLGKVAIVWVQIGVTGNGSNIFQARVVTAGHRSGDKVEILEGLTQNEKIAKDAGYLADGETNIQY